MESIKRFTTQRELVREEALSLTRLSIPIALANVLEIAPIMLTSILVGQTAGENAQDVIAGGGLGDFFFGLFPSNVMIGIGAAVATLCSQAYGADRQEQYWLLAQAGILASAYSIVPIALLSVFGANILNAMGQDPKHTAIAQSFILIGLVTYPFLVLFMVVRCAFQAQNIALPFVVVSFLSSAISLTVGYALGNYTSLAYIGVSLATILAAVLKALSMIFIVISNHSYRQTWPGWQWREAHRLVCSFWRIGVGSVMMTIFQTGGFMSITMLCGYLPNAGLAIASSSIAAGFIGFAFQPMLSVAIAGTVRIGNALGRGEPMQAALAAKLTLALSFAVSLVCMGLIALLARPYASAFIPDEETIDVTAKITYFLIPVIPLVAITGAAQSVFQACNKQTVGAAINCTFLLVTPIVAGMVFALPLGGWLRGLWGGQFVGQVGMMLVAAVLIKRLNWQHESLKASEHGSEKDRYVQEGSVAVMVPSPAVGFSMLSSAVFVLDQRASTPLSAILGDESDDDDYV